MSGVNEENVCVAVPAYSAAEGLSFLEKLASGNIGAGIKMSTMGHTIPQIRTEYKQLIEGFEAALEAKKAQGLDARALAKWAIAERTKIARGMRAKQGGAAHIVLELRDQLKYGIGGRSYNNLEKRALKRGVPTAELPATMLRNAVRPNQGVSNAALKGAQFLKHGGRAVVVVSISATAYTLLTAPEGQLEGIFYEEVGGVAGGIAGGGAGVGLCILFGIGSGGWGLLACGVVGGGLGGLVGAEAGGHVFLLKEEYVQSSQIGKEGFEIYDPALFIKNVR